MNKENLKAAQYYWNYIVPKYPEKPWKRVEYRHRSVEKWNTYLHQHPVWSDALEYRFKPETVMIGDRKINRWFEGELEYGQEYWMVQIEDGIAYAMKCSNATKALTRSRIATNTVHLTEEACLKHGEALLALPENL